MKKCAFILVLAVLFTLTVQAEVRAEDTVYALEGHFSLSVPSGCPVIMQDTPSDAPVFDLLGVSRDEFYETGVLTDLALIAYSADFEDVFCVRVVEDADYGDFADAGDFALNVIAYTVRMSSGFLDMDIHRHEIYKHAQTRLLKFGFTDETDGKSGTMYITCMGKTAFYFLFLSDTGRFEGKSPDKLIDGIIFENAAD